MDSRLGAYKTVLAVRPDREQRSMLYENVSLTGGRFGYSNRKFPKDLACDWPVPAQMCSCSDCDGC